MTSDPLADEMLEQAFTKLREGFFEDAIDRFNLHLSVNPDEAKAYQGRALANFKIKNWPGALSDFKKAKELNPDDPENWIGLGMSLAITNEIYPAIDVFEALIAKEPTYVRARIQLGQLYYKLGIIKKGHEQMDAVLQLRPSLSERRLAEQYKKEQLTLDKKRSYRPDFEELRKNNAASGPSWWQQFIQSLKKKFFK